MSVLVIGGNGFIGGNLIKRIVPDKETSTVISMDMVPPKETFMRAIETYADKFHFVRGDVSQLEDILAVIKSFSVQKVVNCAFLLVQDTENMPRTNIKVNLLGTCNVFEAARLLGISRVLHYSSSAVYGPQAEYGDREVTEDDLPHPSSAYGIAKQLNDRMAARYAEQYGIDIIGIRPSFGSGHGREAPGAKDRFSLLVSLPAVGKPVSIPDEGSSVYTLSYIDDIVEVSHSLLYAPSPKYTMYNVAGPAVSLSQVAEQVYQYIPDAKIEFGDKPGKKTAPTRINISRAKEEFGFSPTPLKDAVLRHINDARWEAGLEPLKV